MQPAKTYKLNADARAVLLVAQLPTDDLPAAFIIRRGDLHRAPFLRGEERLRQIGLLEGETYNLTDEGVRVARELQENDARLHSGIPYADRGAAITLRGGKETAKVPDEWQTVTLEGQPAYTNGHVLLFGPPPSANRLTKTYQPRLIEEAWKAAGEAAPNVVRPVAYFEQQGYKERTRHVVLSSGVCLDADALNFMLERVPGAVLTHDAGAPKRSPQNVVSFYVEGRRVGMLAPYTTGDREGVTAILEDEGDKGAEQLRPVRTDRERAERVGRFFRGRLNGKADAIEVDYRFFLHAEKLAALAGLSKLGDIYAALRENPAQILTWLLVCWQAAEEELITCTDRTRAAWLEMIAEPGRQGEDEAEGQAEAQPAPEPPPVSPFDSSRATQLGLEFEELAA